MLRLIAGQRSRHRSLPGEAALTGFDVVVPTTGRRSLVYLLEALAVAGSPLPDSVVLVDDRRSAQTPLLRDEPPPELADRLRVIDGAAAGPASARNRGWGAARSEWVVFLDDDVVPTRGWLEALQRDLAAAQDDVGGVQGNLRVPLPCDRRPTDWERNIKGLESAVWATADMAYRRAALEAVGGFDERFPRAYREDCDLALRVEEAGWRLAKGRRVSLHPVRPVVGWVSLRLAAGNADDALMRALHGAGWRERAKAPAGRRPRHLAVSAAAVGAIAGVVAGKRALAAAFAAGWALGTAEFAWARIEPGPRTVDEVAKMIATSTLLPVACSYHWLRGVVRWLPLAFSRSRARTSD